MKNSDLPCSLRTKDSEQAYAEAKIFNKLTPLDQEPMVMEWEYWKLVKNRFPYDVCFKDHDLLIPKSLVSLKEQLSKAELTELDSIILDYVSDRYDLYFENTMKRRSVPSLFHMHFATYYDTRDEMKL